MAEQISYLIIGNGIAGITAAETLRSEDPNATIGIVADDPLPVYYRPALKDYLAGRVDEERLWARPVHLYQEQKIFFLSEHVEGIQAQQHKVQLQSRRQITYGKLLLANGASPARLSCPGCDLPGVTTLRTVADYQAILARLPGVRRVVVVGSGTLALETAESLRIRGLEVSHLLRKQTIWSEVLDTTASDLVIQQELRAGIDVQLETEIVQITGDRNGVKGVVTSQGKRIRCELVLIAIGIEPNIDFMRASGIFCGRGVQVDKNMRTSVPDIYAAGDVLESRSSSGRPRVLGQWYPAIQQARSAAYNMVGIADPAQPFTVDTFYNATFLYGLDFASIGITNQAGYQEIVAEPKPRSYRKVVLQNGVPVGMLSLGERKQALAFKRAIDYRVNLSNIATRLFDTDFNLGNWLDAQGVPPLRMGVRKAGKTAAQKGIAQQKDSEDAEQTEDASTPTGSSDMEDRYTQKIPQSLAHAAEALLVHMPDPKVSLRIAETSLHKDSPLVIGRQPGVDLLINEGSISRQHAEIRYVQDHYELRDFGSLNGTFINDARIEPNKAYTLKPNDVVRVGNIVKVRFLLRLVNVATYGQIEMNTAPLPRARVSGDTPEPVPVVREEAASLNLTGRLSTLKTSADPEKPLPLDSVAALKENPGLIVMPDKKAKKEGAPRIVLLQPGKSVMLGREEGNDVVLDDMDVSRRHAEVFPAPNGVYIRDNNSSNGVFINKSRIEKPYRLSHGDRIKLGNTSIFFVDMQSGREQTTRLTTPSVEPLSQKTAQPARVPVEVTARAEKGPAASVKKEMPVQKAQKNGVQMKNCTRCGTPNMPIARFCARCSAPLFTS
jgi:NADPH-dependent 2,4-dienoyl-CoA reductase/sulfur reductase-like enzyme/pSer/pThr/pTyr-binding forkhead associated (FHA) protein